MSQNDEKMPPIECKLNPLFQFAMWLFCMVMAADVIAMPFGAFLDGVFIYLVMMVALYNSISYLIYAEGITLKLLWWPIGHLQWEDIIGLQSDILQITMYTNMYTKRRAGFWVWFMGTVGGLLFFMRPFFKVTRLHSNYDTMDYTLRQNVAQPAKKKFFR